MALQKGQITTLASAFGTGFAEAASYRFSPMLGTLVTFGGGIAGLLAAMMGRGNMADVGLGIASSSAGSLGHFAMQTIWPARSGRRRLGSGGRSLPAGVPVGGTEQPELVNDTLVV